MLNKKSPLKYRGEKKNRVGNFQKPTLSIICIKINIQYYWKKV